GADEFHLLRASGQGSIGGHRQKGRESHDVVPPERAFDGGQIGFVQVSAIGGRLQVHTADLDVEGVSVGINDDVGAKGAQLTVDLVTDVGGDRDHGRGHRYAQGDGYPG